MKKLRKVFGLVIALSMMLTLAVTASAATITINSPSSSISLEDVRFNAYRIFDLKITAQDEYVYTINVNFADFEFIDEIGFLHKGDDLRTYLSSLEDAGHVDGEGFISTRIAMELTGQLAEYISLNGIPVDAIAIGAPGATSVQINIAEPGYYIVIPEGITAMPILSLLTVANENESVTLKADAPTIDKKVRNNDSPNWGDVADFSIGDEVPFRLTSTVTNMAGYNSYTFTVHDKMSPGLTFNEDVTVTIGANDYTAFDVIMDPTTPEGFQSFRIVFHPDEFIKQTPGDEIEIYYTATLNRDAIIAQEGTPNKEGNPNVVYLEYSNNPYREVETTETPPDEVIVYTFEFEVIKVNGEGKRIDGAEFVLFRGDTFSPEYAIITVDSVNKTGKITGWTNVGDIDAATKFIVNENFTISGLDEGRYYLKETKAPAGYNMLEEPAEINIRAEYVEDKPELRSVEIIYNIIVRAIDTDANNIVEVVIENNAGALFPETGGIGTTIFTIVGITLMTGAAVILIAKKKVSSTN